MKKILTTLSEKWPEYLLEIFVLIIGIYGAFAVDSWNENRKARVFEQKMLGELIVGLNRDISDLEWNRSLNEKALASQKRILKWMDNEIDYYDTLCYDFGKSNYWISLSDNNGAYQNLKSKDITLITSDSIRNAIVMLYEVSYDYYEEVEKLYHDLLLHKWNNIDPKYFQNSSLNEEGKGSSFYVNCQQPISYDQLRKNNEFRVHLEQMKTINNHLISEMRRVERSARKARDLIQRYLKNQ